MSYFVFRTFAMMSYLSGISRVVRTSSRFLSFSQNVHFNISSPERLIMTVPDSVSQSRYLHGSPVRLQTKSTAEEGLIKALTEAFPAATDIAVVDVSGGCGAMYEVYVEAPDFAKMRLVKQHQLVTRALSSQIKDMHGIRISTGVSKPS